MASMIKTRRSTCIARQRMLSLLLAGTVFYPSLHAAALDRTSSIANFSNFCPIPTLSLNEIRKMLYTEAPSLNANVIHTVLSILQSSNQNHVTHNNMLTIIDYSLPASDKRLWIFDLDAKKLLFHTYVSHGIKSGALLSTQFSNKYDSKASSIGVYTTQKTYHGRHGLSLQLNGLETNFNSNASNRAIVMHGGWYVEEGFIKKYGRAGRSWGCPAVPDKLTDPILNAIKENALLVIYYPSDDWFSKSRFLKYAQMNPKQVHPVNDNGTRDDILFTDIHQRSKSEENTAVAVISADSYARLFHTTPPLARMLRRQINNAEYIALSPGELDTLIANHTLNEISFVNPVIKMSRGYYITDMHIATFGKIKEITLNTNPSMNHKAYTVMLDENKAMSIKSTDRFIRWIGL